MLIKTILRILGGSVLVGAALTLLLYLLQPRIPLAVLTGPLSSFLSFLTGSEQVIRGNYFLVPGEWITFAVENGSIALTGNEQFKLAAEIESAQTTVHLSSLFKREIRLDGIALHGATVDLFAGHQKEKPSPGQEKNKNDRSEDSSFSLIQTGHIDIVDIAAAIVVSESVDPLIFQIVRGAGQFSREAEGKVTIEAVIDDGEFRIDIEGGPLSALAALDSDWPFSIHMAHKSVFADVSGAITRLKRGRQSTAIFSLSGKDVDDLVSIFGFQGATDQPFSLQGTATLTPDELRVDFRRIQLGTDSFQAAASVKGYGIPGTQYFLKVQGETLNLDRLKRGGSQKRESSARSQSPPKTDTINRDDILLPETLPVSDLTIDLDFKELVLAGKQIKDVQFKAVMVDGQVTESPFTATLPNFSLSGYYSFRLKEKVPQLSAHLKTRSLNIGRILKDLHLSDDIVMDIGKVTTDIKTSGRTLGEIFDNFSFTINSEEGAYEYHDLNTGAVLPVILDNIEIIGAPGDNIRAVLEGRVADTPVSIVTEIDDRRDEPPESVKDVTVAMQIHLADVRWELVGQLPLPFSQEGIILHSKLYGERLNSLNDLLHLQLPGIGPYVLEGKLRIIREGYRLDEILLQIGTSSFAGTVFVDTKMVPPAVHVELQAPGVQLDDFNALWTMLITEVNSSREGRKEKGLDSPENLNFLDRELVDSYNAFIRVAVARVMSGEDFLGSGTVEIEQKNGRVAIDSLNLQLPGGEISAALSVEPLLSSRHYHMNILIKDLDYGIVGRWFKPDTDMSGIITLRTSIAAESTEVKDIMANASGFLDISVQPGKLRAGVIDLWAVNLFSYLVPFLVPKGESKINCLAGRFNLQDGILRQEEFLIDTSQIQVKGVVEVDFKSGFITATLRPIPKRPQFYSLSVPIEIHGSLSNLDARLAKGGVIGTIIRLATSYVVVPLQWIIQNRLPEDGTPACLQLVEERSQSMKQE